MSGGSYNYLFNLYDLDDLYAKKNEIEHMALRLEGLPETEFPGAAAAAAMTRAFQLKVETWEKHITATAKHMGGVWKAVEWWDSCDSGPKEVKEALEQLTNG